MNRTRIATGAVLIPIVLAVVWFLPPGWFTGLIILAAAVGQHEFYAMAKNKGAKPLEVIGIVLGGLLIIMEFGSAAAFGLHRSGVGFSFALCVVIVLAGRLFSSQTVDSALEDIAATMFGIMYVALLLGYQAGVLRWHYQGKNLLVFLYLVIWASDTGAYYVGTAWGKRRLYEKVSPKKSVEGLLGGTAAAMLVALLCRFWLLKGYGVLEAIVLGAVLALAGAVGDLAESLIKRSAGVKDSGSLFPGHGGVLDRLDSMMFAAPVLYYYLRMR